MEYIHLNNGLKMPMPGIGTFQLSPDKAKAFVLNAYAKMRPPVDAQK